MGQIRQLREKFHFLLFFLFFDIFEYFFVLDFVIHDKWAICVAFNGSFPRFIINECELPKTISFMEIHNIDKPLYLREFSIFLDLI